MGRHPAYSIYMARMARRCIGRGTGGSSDPPEPRVSLSPCARAAAVESPARGGHHPRAVLVGVADLTDGRRRQTFSTHHCLSMVLLKGYSWARQTVSFAPMDQPAVVTCGPAASPLIALPLNPLHARFTERFRRLFLGAASLKTYKKGLGACKPLPPPRPIGRCTSPTRSS